MSSIVVATDISWPSPSVEAELLARAGLELVVAERGDEAELLSLVPEARAILTCWRRVSAAVIAAAPRLEVISRFGVGVDNIDVEAATGQGVLVTNVPAYCDDEVAEHTLALLLAHVRRIPAFDAAVRAQRWSPVIDPPLRRVRGAMLGFVGFGANAQAVARRAEGLGLRLLAHTRAGTVEGWPQVTFCSLERLLADSDVVSLHIPLTDATRGLIDRDALARMRPSALLINTSRGAVVDLAALDAALRSGSIGGAALDVTDPEPLPPGHALLSAPNVILTPHIAFSSAESLRTLCTVAADNVVVALAGDVPAHVVNPGVLTQRRRRPQA